jgi:DNA invertase Pin-like site-specific DNA recombinase
MSIMPYKSEKIKLKGMQDRRKKLTDEQREEIKKLYETGLHSLNALAKQFGVSKKTVLLIVNKDSAEKAKRYRKEHWKEWQRTGKEWNEVVKEHRKYKHELYKNGKLKEDE